VWLDIVFIHVRWDGTVCDADHIVDSRVTVLTVSIIDVILFSLTLFGLLRWKVAPLTWAGGILRVMYTQVGISHPVAARLTIQLNLVLGIGTYSGCHDWICTRSGAFCSVRI
jgi:uncharacterized membrane protein